MTTIPAKPLNDAQMGGFSFLIQSIRAEQYCVGEVTVADATRGIILYSFRGLSPTATIRDRYAIVVEKLK